MLKSSSPDLLPVHSAPPSSSSSRSGAYSSSSRRSQSSSPSSSNSSININVNITPPPTTATVRIHARSSSSSSSSSSSRSQRRSVHGCVQTCRAMKKTLLAAATVLVLTAVQYQTAVSLTKVLTLTSTSMNRIDEGILAVSLTPSNKTGSLRQLIESPVMEEYYDQEEYDEDEDEDDDEEDDDDEEEESDFDDDYVKSFEDVEESAEDTLLSTAAAAAASSMIVPAKKHRSSQDDTFSSCLMVMDDNHRLTEWLAYHYSVLNLRHLVILSDPRSRYSPTDMLQKWRPYITIEEWNETSYMDADFTKRSAQYFSKNQTDRRVKQQYHMERQAKFIRKCALHLQELDKTWVSFHDIDEYYVVNSDFVVNATARMQEPGSVVRILNEAQDLVTPIQKLTSDKLIKDDHYSSPCVTTYRTPYGAVESTPQERQQDVPDFINTNKFETFRWRHHKRIKSTSTQIGKSIMDVSRVPDLGNMTWPDRPRTPFSPHRLVPMCSNVHYHPYAFVRINHYVGSWEYYSYRQNDGRAGANKNRRAWEQKSNLTGGNFGDEARPWIKAFLKLFDIDQAKLLLADSGLPDNYTAPVSEAWLHPSDRKRLAREAAGETFVEEPPKKRRKKTKKKGKKMGKKMGMGMQKPKPKAKKPKPLPAVVAPATPADLVVVDPPAATVESKKEPVATTSVAAATVETDKDDVVPVPVTPPLTPPVAAAAAKEDESPVKAASASTATA